MKLKVPKVFKSVRHGLAAVNGLFLLTGLLILAAGISVLVIYKEYDLFITQRFFTLPGFVIATGIIILITSLLGVYGAYSEKFYFIAAYVVLMLVILVFELAAVITSFGLRENSVSQIRAPMIESLNQYQARQEIAIMWDNLQMGYECCGVTSRFDWPASQIPISCCNIDFGTISPFVCNTGNAYTTGCATALGERLSYNAQVLGYVLLFVTCLQVVMTAAAGWLAYRSKFEEVELES